MIIKKLDWDSHFFQKNIGEIIVNQTSNGIIGRNEFDLLYVKQKEDISFELENFKQTYSETKIVFSKTIVLDDNLLTDEFIISAFDTAISKEQIYELAFESGKYSRFKLDHNFNQIKFQKLYRKWVDNSLIKDFADDVLLYKFQNSIFGFVTYKVFENYATIGLIGINPKEQGKGIGSKLIRAVEKKLMDLNIHELRIPTQLQNEQACNFYAKLEYNIIEKIIIKHYWRL